MMIEDKSGTPFNPAHRADEELRKQAETLQKANSNQMTKCDNCQLYFEFGNVVCPKCDEPTQPISSDDPLIRFYHRVGEVKQVISVNDFQEELEQDSLRAEDPFLLNHHPYKKDGPIKGPRKEGM